MYTLSEIKTLHLEVTSKCQASCPMCGRNVHGGIDNPYIKLNEISIDQFKQWFPLEFISQLETMYMCRDLGDPIIAKDIIPIISYCREVNPRLLMWMNTNGSARDSIFLEISSGS